MTTAAALLTWRVWPLWDRDPAAWGWLLGTLGLAASLEAGLSPSGLGLLAAALLLFVLRRIFLPITYQLSPEGVEVRVLGRHTILRWRKVRRYELYADGLWVLFSEEPLVGELARGIYIPFGTQADFAFRRSVLKLLRQQVGPPLLQA